MLKQQGPTEHIPPSRLLNKLEGYDLLSHMFNQIIMFRFVAVVSGYIYISQPGFQAPPTQTTSPTIFLPRFAVPARMKSVPTFLSLPIMEIAPTSLLPF